MSQCTDKIVENALCFLKDYHGIVVLGAGIPLRLLPKIKELGKGNGIVVLSENGVLGMEANAHGGKDLTDAMGDAVGICDGGALMDSANAFCLIRSGRVGLALVGALEVDTKGNVACHEAGARIFGYGGALDIYMGCQCVVALIPDERFVEKISLTVSAFSAIDLVITEKGVFDVRRK